MLGHAAGGRLRPGGREAARTVPPRENGGNQDIKNLIQGQPRSSTRCSSTAPSCPWATCTSPRATARSRSAGPSRWAASSTAASTSSRAAWTPTASARTPIFMPGTRRAAFSEWLAFSGTSVTLDGEQHYLDSHLSYQRACLHAIDYLKKFGYSARAGLPAARRGADRGPPVGRGGHPELLLDRVHAHGDLRLRRAAVGRRSVPGRPGNRGAPGGQPVTRRQCAISGASCASVADTAGLRMKNASGIAKSEMIAP